MLPEKLKEILNKCNQAYSEGKFYKITKEDEHTLLTYTGRVQYEGTDVTDQIYDNMYSFFKELYPDDPFFKKLTSNNTGYGVDVDLPIPAGSLDECKLGDLASWVDPESNYVITEKLDGCSIILFYKKGLFCQAVTRGDGHKGKDVTRHIKHMVTPIVDTNFTGMIRGEVICPKESIDLMIWNLKQETGREYKNGRNTIAGFLNSKETLQAVLRYAQVVVYSIMDSQESQEEQLKFLKWWFPMNTVSNQIVSGKDINDEDMIKLVNHYKTNGKYEVDGIVITKNVSGSVTYETNSINPTHARKFKMISMLGESGARKRTKVIDITWNPSKNGCLKPIVNIEPVDISGSTVSNVTGFNYAWLEERQIGIGSEIDIIRSGDVIPKIVGVHTFSSNMNIPSNCHIEGVELVLDNASNSKEVSIKKLVHFSKTLELDQAGEASMEKLLDQYPSLVDPVNMVDITMGSFKEILGVNGIKLFESLQKAVDNMTESKLADACGVFGGGLGESLLKLVEEKYSNLQKITEDIEGFGPIRIDQYNNNFDKWEKTKKLYESFGGKFIKATKNISTGNVLTPTGVRFKPDQKQKLLEQGWTVSDSLNKSTTCLVVKDINSTSSKVQKAKSLGITIKTYDDIVTEFNL